MTERVRKFNYRPSGDVGYSVIQSNFDKLQENLDTVNETLELIVSRNYSNSRAILVEGTSAVTLMEARDHNNCKLISAFVIAADNLNMDQKIRIVIGNTDIVEPKTIKATEKSGKSQDFNIIERMQVNRTDDIRVIPSSVRKVIVVANLVEVST